MRQEKPRETPSISPDTIDHLSSGEGRLERWEGEGGATQAAPAKPGAPARDRAVPTEEI
jgi:hypothetical protein